MTELPTAFVAAMLKLTVALSGGQLPDHPPRVVLMPEEKMHELARCKEGCTAHAYYLHWHEMVVIREENDPRKSIHSLALLVHELKHHQQHLVGYDPTNCWQLRKAEVEAYRTQNQFLQWFGLKSFDYQLYLPKCEE